jgi:hypothetical protein
MFVIFGRIGASLRKFVGSLAASDTPGAGFAGGQLCRSSCRVRHQV